MGCATSTIGKVDVATYNDETKEGQVDAAKVKTTTTVVEEASEAIEPAYLRERKPSSDAISKQGERIKWRKGDLIGSGANGRVYLGLEEDTGAIIAVKEIVFSDISPNREELEQMQEEIELLRTLRHPNIVAYLGTDVDDENRTLYIFTEWVPGGSIQALVTKFGRLPETIVRKYVAQLLVGLQYLHDRQVIHRDIKAANILVDDRGSIKLADFGSSKRMDSVGSMGNGNNSVVGTPYYMAPEVITQAGHGRKADIWSVGCTILQMVTGKPPWKSLHLNTPAALMYHIANSLEPPPMPDTLSPELRAILMQCFSRDVDKRPSASELLQHPFIIAEGAAAEAIEAGNQATTLREIVTGADASQLPPTAQKMTVEKVSADIKKSDDKVAAIVADSKGGADNNSRQENCNILTLGSRARSPSSSRIVPEDTLPAIQNGNTRLDKAKTNPTCIMSTNGEESDELLITTFISEEAAAQFAGADKHFPGRPTTARPKGAPPPRTAQSSHDRRHKPVEEGTIPHSRLSTTPRQVTSGRGSVDIKASLLMAEKTAHRNHRNGVSMNASVPGRFASLGAANAPTLDPSTQEARAANTLSHYPHDDRPIITEAARRERAAEIEQEKMRAELKEQRVRKNVEFQKELDKFKASFYPAKSREPHRV